MGLRLYNDIHRNPKNYDANTIAIKPLDNKKVLFFSIILSLLAITASSSYVLAKNESIPNRETRVNELNESKLAGENSTDQNNPSQASEEITKAVNGSSTDINSSDTEVKIRNNNQPTEDSSSSGEIRVNDEIMPIPANGNVQKSIQTDDGNVNIHIQSHNSQENVDTNGREGDSKIRIRASSITSSETSIKQEEQVRIRE